VPTKTFRHDVRSALSMGHSATALPVGTADPMLRIN
jgi:hypothetical protein